MRPDKRGEEVVVYLCKCPNPRNPRREYHYVSLKPPEKRDELVGIYKMRRIKGPGVEFVVENLL